MHDDLKTALDDLAALQALGLCHVSADALQVTTAGWYFGRAVAMVFDRHLRGDQVRQPFLRIS